MTKWEKEYMLLGGIAGGVIVNLLWVVALTVKEMI